VRFYGASTAIVNGKTAFAGADGTLTLLQTIRVWVKLEGAWKVAAFQATPVK
jgi:hypothetical protein